MRKSAIDRIARVALFLGLIAPCGALAATPDPPDWAGEPGSVRHLYVFPDNSMEPAPDESDNPFGMSGAIVGLGAFAAGWQNPDPTLDPPQRSGAPGHGAWDLGAAPDGAIRVTVPVRNIAAGTGAAGYAVDLHVNVVGYVYITALPVLRAIGYSLTNVTVEDSLAFKEPAGGQWKNRAWSARIEDVMEDDITLIVESDPDWFSLIDTIEIYALAADHAVWAGDGKSPVWWADRVGGEDGSALSVYDGYLINQQDLDRPFVISGIGFDEDGRPMISWESSGPARGAIRMLTKTDLTDGQPWTPMDGAAVHDDGINLWKADEAPDETGICFRVEVGDKLD